MDGAVELPLTILGTLVFLVLGAGAFFLRGVLADRRERRRMKDMEKSGRHIPPSLHPVIDAQLCISSAACVAACPEGDVIGLIGGAGRLIHGAACVGHGRCAVECPVDAIKLVFGTAERGVDIPHLTGNFETNVPGVYIAGELGGMGLIRNAMRQGIGAARHAVSTLPEQRTSDIEDILIVGAGPAGIGATLACIEAGASYTLIDQSKLGGSPANFPRQKIVMTEPIKVPLVGTIHKAEMLKEELIATWHRIVEEVGIQVNPMVKFTGLTGQDGHFIADTSMGKVAARKVIIAIGRRGSPRKLDVPGEEQSHVAYELLEPEQYKGASVMVVGGGDSALEAAWQLAEGGSKVTLVHRGDGFRGKEKNVKHVEELEKKGLLRVLLKTNTKRVLKDKVEVATPNGTEHVPARWVLVLVGGELPIGLLKTIGIKFERWFGDAPKETQEAGKSAAKAVGSGAQSSFIDRWIGAFLFTSGLLGLGYLGYVGRAYYLLSAAEREASVQHALLRSSGLWGHGIGVVATLVMMTNFLYSARKRIGALRTVGTMKSWLTVHVLVGLLAPAYIAFHAAFNANNFIAAITYYAVGAVVLTGLIGRYIYGRMHTVSGNEDALEADLSAASADGKAPARKKVQQVTGAKRLMRSWRMLHVLLALLMVVVICVHVAVSILFGYRWIFS